MTQHSSFAYDPAGRTIVIFDGKEVLVHGGGDESPQWRKELEAEIIGLATAGEAVVTLEAGGKISWWSMAKGELLASTTTGAEAFALVSARSAAVCLAVLPGGVEIAEQGKELRSLPFPGEVTAAALRDDGKQIAIGGESGEVAIAGLDGAKVAESKLDGQVNALCWSPAGFWIATWGDRIVRVDPEGGAPRPITRGAGFKPDCVATSADGALFAMRLDEHMMMSYGYPPGEQVVQLRYFDREITGIAFGPGHRLGVGLLGGDGNIVDIPGNQLLRTDTFEGRKHNRWMVGTNINGAAVPKGSAAAPATPAAAPERPKGRPRLPDDELAPPDPAANRFPTVWVGVALLVVIAVVVALVR